MINFVKTDDIELVINIHYSIFNFDFPMSSYYKKQRTNDLNIYLYEENGEYLGYSIIVDQAEIKNFYAWYGGVIPSRQGQGINSDFFDVLIEEAKKKDYSSITLATTNERPHMLILAIRKGFKIYDIKKRDYGEGNKIYFIYKL